MSDERGEQSVEVATGLRTPFVWTVLLALGLGCFLYYSLFFPPDHTKLVAQGEEFFFEANEAAGAPVLLLSLWLLYRRSHYRDVLRGAGALVPGLAALALTVALYVWGAYTRAEDIQLASVMGLLTGVVLLLGGRAGLRAYWLPIVFLAFALPLSPVLLSAAMYPIQLATASYAGVILNSIGVASYVQGDQILRPENTFVVIETCSGVRTIVTLSMLTVLLIDLFERRGAHAVILILLAPFVAFLTNGLRVVTLVLNPHSSIHSIHNLQGVAMLLVGLTAIYLLDLLLERALGSRAPRAEEGDYGVAQGEGVPGGQRTARLLLVVAALLAMLGIGRSITPWTYDRGLAEMPDALLARVFGEEASRPVQPDYQFMGSVRYLAHARRRVDLDGRFVDIHLGVGDEQQRKHTLLTRRLAWPDSGYALVDARDETLGDGAPRARRTVLRRGARVVLSYSFYERAGGLPAEWLRQAAALDRSPFVRPAHMLAIRISTSLGPGGSRVEEAEARIRRAWALLEPELADYARMRVPTGGSPLADGQS
ncbi:MAG: hypothetical protein CL908_01325 [Deltaproteobacteria bacterium]|nr:hypothetical protein [Deltaproteobacteria bacterium]